jgi:hypothetical protein
LPRDDIARPDAQAPQPRRIAIDGAPKLVDREADVAVDEGEVVTVGRREPVEQCLVGPGTLRPPAGPHLGWRLAHGYCAP